MCEWVKCASDPHKHWRKQRCHSAVSAVNSPQQYDSIVVSSDDRVGRVRISVADFQAGAQLQKLTQTFLNKKGEILAKVER
jgi:hypothetical protein